MTRAVTQAKLWYANRMSALALSLFVLVHLAIIVYAVRGGLSAAEILGRTRGSWLFGAFYGAFVVACAIHVPLGLAKVAEEWLGCSERVALWLATAFGLLTLVMGLRAVVAVVGG
jgi:fumarate reductase subunit C